MQGDAICGQNEAVQTILHGIRDHDEKRSLAIEACHWAVSADALAITQLLLLTMNNVSIPINELKRHQTALINAITSRHHEMVQLLFQMGADTEMRCADGITPLMHAVRSGNKITVSLILTKAKADATSLGWIALHTVADMGDCEMVNLLLTNDADIGARSLKTFQKRFSPTSNGSPIQSKVAAAQIKNVDIGWTALLRAADRGDEEMVKLLLNKGAKVDAENLMQFTPLMCASEAKHE